MCANDWMHFPWYHTKLQRKRRMNAHTISEWFKRGGERSEYTAIEPAPQIHTIIPYHGNGHDVYLSERFQCICVITITTRASISPTWTAKDRIRRTTCKSHRISENMWHKSKSSDFVCSVYKWSQQHVSNHHTAYFQMLCVVMWSLSSSSSSLDRTYMLLCMRCALVSLSVLSILFVALHSVFRFTFLFLSLSLFLYLFLAVCYSFLLFPCLSVEMSNVIVYRLRKYAKNVCHTIELNPNPAIRLIF